MTYSIRNVISSTLLNALNLRDGSKVNNCINAALSLQSFKSTGVEIHLSVKDLKSALSKAGVDKNAITTDTLAEASQLQFDKSLITETDVRRQCIAFKLDRRQFLQETFKHQNTVKLFDEPKETVIVEYSSPNIAKPFHMGHLRSTIIGNFVANVLDAYDHNVVRINYLGDWGTQFGFLKLGMDMAHLPEEEIRKNPIRHLFNAYVNANRLAETDETFAEQARAIFSQMENGQLPDLEAWNQYREYTVAELESVYRRLGVKFDVYAWESQYRKTQIQPVLDQLKSMDLVESDADGKQTFTLDDGNRIALLKSDGSTLYLTRDVAAIVDRQKQYQFDRMYYVVGNEQHNHFHALFNIARRLGVPNADKLEHIKFGRVEKMSTRRGNVVFLADLLNEIKELMLAKQQRSPNTKIDLDADHSTADILGVSALVVFELQRKPSSSYVFDTETVLSGMEAKGRDFQITHCRLSSLEERCASLCIHDELNPDHLTETEALSLAVEIARFPEMLYRAKEAMGPQILLSYMFYLNTSISRALKALNVKDEPNVDRQTQRILLFRLARNTLAKCMRMIGLTPLTKM